MIYFHEVFSLVPRPSGERERERGGGRGKNDPACNVHSYRSPSEQPGINARGVCTCVLKLFVWVNVCVRVCVGGGGSMGVTTQPEFIS